ncbi:phage tail tube protein [Solidesulfovibrio sp.]
MADQQMQLTRKAVVLAKREETYGQKPAMGPENGVYVNNGVDVEPTGEKVKRDVVRGTFSPAGAVIGSKKITFKAQVELRGGGLDGTGKVLPPDCEPFLLACGTQRTDVVRLTVPSVTGFLLGESVAGGTSAATGTIHHFDGDMTLVLRNVTGVFAAEQITGASSNVLADVTAVAPGIEYRPATKRPLDQDSAAVLFYKDAILYTSVGTRGTFTLNCAVNKYPLFDFTMTGLWTDPADAGTIPVPELTKIVPPMFMGANVIIDDYRPVITELTYAMGNTIADRLDANAAEGMVGAIITGREPTGSVNPEMDALANFNPWAKWKTAQTSRIATLFGSDPGNRIRIELPAAQYDGLKHGDRSGIAAYAANYIANAHRDAGDDEWRLTIL